MEHKYRKNTCTYHQSSINIEPSSDITYIGSLPILSVSRYSRIRTMYILCVCSVGYYSSPCQFTKFVCRVFVSPFCFFLCFYFSLELYDIYLWVIVVKAKHRFQHQRETYRFSHIPKTDNNQHSVIPFTNAYICLYFRRNNPFCSEYNMQWID